MVDAVYPWLEKYANKQASYTLVEQKIELELAVMGVTFRDDLWGDILEQISMSPTGWQDVQAAWQDAKTSGMCDNFIQRSRCSFFCTQSTVIAGRPQGMAAYSGMGIWAVECRSGRRHDGDGLRRTLRPQ